MATGLVFDSRFLAHDTGAGHPERPQRLSAIIEGLRSRHLFDQLTAIDAIPASMQWIERLHNPAYIARVRGACEAGERYIDTADSAICVESFDTAILAVGGVLAAVDAVMAGRVVNAFCAVRPPGHHAECDRSMGFCLFNNIAIAAEYLVHHHGLKRVAIVDWDVHHGNGTQHLFEDRNDILFISLHEHPAVQYPGTGYHSEKGRGAGVGHTLNITFDPHTGDEGYRREMLLRVMPALDKFDPQFILISAGFDAARGDPLGHMDLTPQCFAWMTQQLKVLAEKCCQGRLVSVLEGGYNLSMLAQCVAAHVDALMRDEGEDPLMAMKAGL